MTKDYWTKRLKEVDETLMAKSIHVTQETRDYVDAMADWIFANIGYIISGDGSVDDATPPPREAADD